MSRVILTGLLIILVSVFSGCYSADSGRSRLVSPAVTQLQQASSVQPGQAGESDIVEQVAVNRQGYQQGLEMLSTYYRRSGNNMKLNWAEKELKAVNSLPKYNYIIEAAVAGSQLKASASITEADYMYDDALRTEKNAGKLLIIKNEDKLRLALAKYDRLIKRHPSSDKIDDSAFRAGGICEYFKDYTIALLYYQRAYQWDTDTSCPARFKAAYILDRHLHRRLEALELYQDAVKKGKLNASYKEIARRRISELISSEQNPKE